MKYIYLILIGLLLIAGGFGVAKAVSEQYFKTSVAQEWIPTISAGVVKPLANGTWYILDDSNHTQIGLTDISQTSSYIRVYYPTCSKIVSANITGDEVFASADLQVGASVGLSYSDIYIYRDRGIINPSAISNTGSNIWFNLICE